MKGWSGGGECTIPLSATILPDSYSPPLRHTLPILAYLRYRPPPRFHSPFSSLHSPTCSLALSPNLPHFIRTALWSCWYLTVYCEGCIPPKPPHGSSPPNRRGNTHRCPPRIRQKSTSSLYALFSISVPRKWGASVCVRPWRPVEPREAGCQ